VLNNAAAVGSLGVYFNLLKVHVHAAMLQKLQTFQGVSVEVRSRWRQCKTVEQAAACQQQVLCLCYGQSAQQLFQLQPAAQADFPTYLGH
jgi:hypothetical protein